MRALVGPLLAAALAAVAAPASALPPVWVVKDHDSTLTLFGSVHLLPTGVNWKPPALETAMAGADEVWFEAPMDAEGQQAALQAALDNAYLPAGQSLNGLLTAKGRERMARACAKFRLDPAVMDRLQPWYAELMISSALYQKLGALGSEGVEQQLWGKAPTGARRHSLETPAEQVGFFAKAPLPAQLATLEQALAQVDDAEKEFGELLAAWLKPDLKRLERKAVRPLRRTAPALYAAVVVERNRRWTEEIARRMQGSGDTVVVVGMGHLIGPDGLPAQLRARGYHVEGPR